jgi:hypothetical protein
VSEHTLRAVLYAVAAFHLGLGLLMVIDPGTFFEEVGPYGLQNDHYIGDVAAFYLAAGVGVLIAARRPSWREPLLVVGAVWYGLHALNHLVDIEEASSDAKGIFDTIALAIGAVGSAYLARVSAQLASA